MRIGPPRRGPERIIFIVDGVRLQVEHCEALHMTPILDVKPVLEAAGDL